MKKSTQDKEIEKLKKQVEKLKEKKIALQKDNRNLKNRLSTARAKTYRYHSELKKKEIPNVGLDKATYELMMSLLDDIITPI